MTFVIFQTARYVAVRKNDSHTLALGEVKVFADCQAVGSMSQDRFVRQTDGSQTSLLSPLTFDESIFGSKFDCILQCSMQHPRCCQGFYFRENDGQCFIYRQGFTSEVEGKPQWTKYLRELQ